MKLYSILLTLLLTLLSCNDEYQNGVKNLTINDTSRNVLEATTTEKTFQENMQEFLDRFIVLKGDGTKDTLVDYKDLFATKNQDDILELRQNLYTQIAKMNYGDLNKDEKAAFLINTYNFLVIETIIGNFIKDGSQISNIKQIGAFEFAAFSEYQYNVAGNSLSLDQIEKETLKPLLTFPNGSLDARFHFAVICGAKGCPVLRTEAYLAEELDRQLEDATNEGLALERNFKNENDSVSLSKIFEWYSLDFAAHSKDGGEKTGSTLAFLNQYLSDIPQSNTFQYTPYDWNLNIFQ